MKSGQQGRTLAEAENRYRGDRVPVSTCDPREAQREFDEEAAAIELARFHVERVNMREALRRVTGSRFGRAVVWS